MRKITVKSLPPSLMPLLPHLSAIHVILKEWQMNEEVFVLLLKWIYMPRLNPHLGRVLSFRTFSTKECSPSSSASSFYLSSYPLLLFSSSSLRLLLNSLLLQLLNFYSSGFILFSLFSIANFFI